MRASVFGACALLLLALTGAAGAQAPIAEDDPRARLAAGIVAPLLAGDTAAAAAFLRRNLAATADEARLVGRLNRVREMLGAGEDRRITDYVGGPNDSGGVRLSEGLMILVEVSGEPPGITNLIMGRMRETGAAEGPGERFATLDALDRHLREATAQDRFSGVVLASRGEEVLFHRAYGQADRERGIAVRPDTRFNLGSIDKAFTGVAILRLAQEGRLRLDDPIGEHVEGLSPEIASKVTLRHLLQHRGGVGNYLADPRFQREPMRYGRVDALLELIRDRPLEFEPGTQQRYSNSGFVLLGAAIEALTGRSYHEVVRDWVFAPAGMTATGPGGPAEVSNTALGYSRGGPGSDAPLALSSFRAPGTPAGGGYATAEDLRRFLRALAAGRLLDPRHTDILLNGYDEPALRPTHYGIAGGAPGINAIAEINLARDEVVVVMTNLDPPSAQALGSSLLPQLPGF